MDIPDLFRGERVRISARRKTDYAAVARWSTDSGYISNIQVPAHPITPEQAQAAEAEAIRCRNSLIFRLRTIPDDHLIGTIGFYDVHQEWQSAEYGIAIGEAAYRGKGYGTEATRLMIAYGFLELNLHRIWLRVIDTNIGGIKAYEKSGFTYEGRKRHGFRRNNVWHDTLFYSILRPEWDALQAELRTG